MIPWLWIRANGGAHFWDGKNGERTGLGTRGVKSSFEGTDGWETARWKERQLYHGHLSLGHRGDCRAGERNMSVSTGWVMCRAQRLVRRPRKESSWRREVQGASQPGYSVLGTRRRRSQQRWLRAPGEIVPKHGHTQGPTQGPGSSMTLRPGPVPCGCREAPSI